MSKYVTFGGKQPDGSIIGLDRVLRYRFGDLPEVDALGVYYDSEENIPHNLVTEVLNTVPGIRWIFSHRGWDILGIIVSKCGTLDREGFVGYWTEYRDANGLLRTDVTCTEYTSNLLRWLQDNADKELSEIGIIE